MIRGNNFRLDLADFEKLSRDVGYWDLKSNTRDHNDEWDLEAFEKHDELREKQLIMFEEMLKAYSK